MLRQLNILQYGQIGGLYHRRYSFEPITSGAPPVPPPQPVIWFCEAEHNQISELSTTDFSTIRQATSPEGGPWGIGGNASVIWHCATGYYDRVYELSTTDFSVIRYAAPLPRPSGIGGAEGVIWAADDTTVRVYELSTTDFSVVRSCVFTYIEGIGGDNSVIWACSLVTDRIYELSTTDFSVVRYASSPGSWPLGIGGHSTVIWHCDHVASRAYELSTTDFSVIKSGSVAWRATGIGGA